MEKSPIVVMTLDSESEDDELQIVSENITNYGNYSKPVEISPELQQKLIQSLKKSGHPVNINAIKIFATKTNNNEKGTVRACFNSGDGLSQVINVGPAFKENFFKQVQGEINNNVDPLAINSKKSKGAKRTGIISKSTSKDLEPVRDERPKSPPSSVILFKGKQSHLARKNSLKKKTPTNLRLKKLMPQNTPNIMDFMDISDPLMLDTKDKGFEDASSNSVELPSNKFAREFQVFIENSPTAFSPVRIACDENEGLVENSFGSVSLPEKYLNALDKHECSEELQNQETKQIKENNHDILHQVQQKRNKQNSKFMKIEFPKQDFNVREKRNKTPSIIGLQEMVENSKQTMSSTIKESPRHEKKNQEKMDVLFNEEKDEMISSFPLNRRGFPPLWSTLFPPSPPSPPPPVWHGSTHLWQLEPLQFQGVTGLCRNEAAAEIRRLQAAPKPVARVLRQKRKKKEIDADFLKD